MHKILSLLLFIHILFSLGCTEKAEAAILDDFVDKISRSKAQRKHHHVHHRYHYHEMSDQKKWQTSLHYLGYYHGKIDGDLYTKESFRAINDFQKRRQELATGFLEDPYKSYLSQVYRVIILKKYLDYEGRSRKKNRRKLQAALAIEGVYHGKVDGVLGKKSKRSIAAYKKRLDLNAIHTTSLNGEERKKLIEDAKILADEQLATFRREDASYSKQSDQKAQRVVQGILATPAKPSSPKDQP